jgi:uncharacterized protein (TIGR02271 family)
MANKPPVHVELKENRWAVLREGAQRVTSVYPTQSEAATEGRELARREETEFFLHAQDGRVREHRNYGEGSPTAAPQDRGIVDQATQTAGTLAGGVVDAASRTVGVAGAAVPTPENRAGGEEERPGGTTGVGSGEATPGEATPGEGTNDAEEARILTDAQQDDTSSTPEERYAGYEVYDRDGLRLGKPDDLFVDENDNPEYVGVWTDSLGTRSILIPAEVVTVEDTLRRMVVSRPKSVVEAAPSLGRGEELTPNLEERVRTHYGLASLPGAEGRGGYGAYYRGDAEHAQEQRGGLAEPSVPEGDEEEELRVRRSEEELRVGTREREAGVLRVRKRVRTDKERIVVPKKRVEVTVERVPVVEGEAGRTEIGEDEIVVPITEEEVVVEKRQVVKEELRIRKEVVEEAEVVEEEVRREEIEVDDQTEHRDV